MSFTVYHADHGITEAQMGHIQTALQGSVEDGFFISRQDIPPALGTVPCGLHGPAMGDPEVSDDEAELLTRGDRPYADRMVSRPFRPVGYVQCIGIREGDTFTLFTVYGGPLAPQHPEDPTNPDREAAQAFWDVHALSKEA